MHGDKPSQFTAKLAQHARYRLRGTRLAKLIEKAMSRQFPEGGSTPIRLSPASDRHPQPQILSKSESEAL